MTRRLIGGIVVLVLSASTAAAQQADTQPPGSRSGMGGRGMTMMTDSLNQRLDNLVSLMNRTTGTTKVDAMAAVINELVRQRRTMMDRVHAQMMSGGMMMMGDSAPPRSSPAGKADTAVADTTDHAAHHPRP